MIVIEPILVTDATLDSSNVPENDNPEWAPGTFTLGQVVMVATSTPDIHRNYEVVVASTTENPATTTTADWLNLGATNRWAMFDTFNNTQTTNPDSVEVAITMGTLINGVAVLNVNAATVQVIAVDPVEGEVYNRTINLTSASGINNWYDYYFTPIQRLTDAVFLDLPAFPAATITVIAAEIGETVAVGVLAVGVQKSLGVTDHGTGISIIDFSRKEVDAFGNFIIVQRSFSKRADYIVTVETSLVADVQNFLSSIRATPVIWIGNEDFGSTIIYGYYRDFDIVLSSPTISDCNIVVEGLT